MRPTERQLLVAQEVLGAARGGVDRDPSQVVFVLGVALAAAIRELCAVKRMPRGPYLDVVFEFLVSCIHHADRTGGCR